MIGVDQSSLIITSDLFFVIFFIIIIKRHITKLYVKWGGKNRRAIYSYLYKKNLLSESFFRFLKNQPELKKTTLIFLFVIVLIFLPILLITPPSNTFTLLANLFTTFLGIVITVTFISFIQYRESQKRFTPIFHKIIKDIINSNHTFILIMFEKFLAPLSIDDLSKYGSAICEPYNILESYRNFLRRSDLFLSLAKDILNNKIKNDEIHSAKIFLDAKKDLIDSLNLIKRDYISILDLTVINAMEKFNVYLHYSYETEKPKTDLRHSGQWAYYLTNDFQTVLVNCFNLLEAIKQWDQDLDKPTFS